MKKSIIALFALLLSVTFVVPCAAEESEADTLLLAELTEWAARYQERAVASEPLNVPAESLTADGYEFIYDFATLYAQSPEMTEDTVVTAVVITSAEESGPRGTSVDDTAAVILAAFYQENAELRGSRASAVLYSIDLMPETLQWGQVNRDGQRIQTIQYGVHDQLTTGGDGYSDAGIIYTMQEGIVGAIRVYGLNERVSAVQVYEVLAGLRDAALDESYVQVPFSYDGSSLAKFGAEDLLFSGLDFVSLTPETAIAVLGDAIDDRWMEDETSYIRTMTFADAEITFLYDGAKENPRIYMLMLTGDGLEGPRAVRLGDSFAAVFNRFRNGEGEFDGVENEVLYGDVTSGEFGAATYGMDASATLRYGLTLEDGQHVVLHMNFSGMQMSEMMLYVTE